MTQSPSPKRPATQPADKSGAQTAKALRDKAQDAAGKVSEDLSDAADKTRSGAARNVKDMAEALSTAADQLDDNSTQRRVFDSLSDQLDQVSDALHQKDMGEMMRDLNDLARNHPLAFLGGAALLGFAASRVMTAGGSGRNGRSRAGRTAAKRADAQPPMSTPPTTGV